MKILLTACLILIATAGLAVEVRVEIDKYNYSRGEPFSVRVVAVNPQSSPVTLQFYSTKQSTMLPDDYPDTSYGYDVLTSVIVPGNGTYAWTREFDWAAWPLDPGPHMLTGTVIGYGTKTIYFNVSEYVLPRESVLVNFETLPGTEVPCELSDFDDLGMHFTSLDSTSNAPPYVAGGRLISPLCDQPTGYNLHLALDFPVYDVSLDVASATGIHITMLAKNSSGQIIGSVTSGSLVHGTAQPIQLRTFGEIDSLEWWPDAPQGFVIISNLSLNRLPYIFMDCTAQGAALSWPPDVVHNGLVVCTNLMSGIWTSVPSSLGTNEVSISFSNSNPQYYRLRVE
jgi:hypothetical protein